MVVGYIFAAILGGMLALLYYSTNHSRRFKHGAKWSRKLLVSFHECASLFAFSLQIACIVVLARVDYGISTASMGNSTVQITWAVSVLTTLPLLYTLVLVDTIDQDSMIPGDRPNHGESYDEKESKASDLETEFRLVLFVICWALSFYPFLSRMIEEFGSSKIGEGEGTVISVQDWNTIQQICLANTVPVTASENRLMNAVGIMGSLILSLFAISKIIAATLQRHYPEVVEKLSQVLRSDYTSRSVRFLSFGVLVAIPLLSGGLLWSFFRLQRFQAGVAGHIGSQDSDDQWSFGQVVAVTVFMPVFVQGLLEWMKMRAMSSGEDESQTDP